MIYTLIVSFVYVAKRRVRQQSGTADVESSSHVTDSDSNDSEGEMEEEEEEEPEEEAPERMTRSRCEAENKTYQQSEPVAEVKPVQEHVPSPVPEKELATEIKDEPILQTETEEEGPKKNIPVATSAKVTNSKQKDVKQENVAESVVKVDTEPVKEEPKLEKKLDDKIYDFDESSSQDSFKNDLLTRPSVAEAKEINERGHFKWKETAKRTRVSSTESTASSGSVAKMAQTKDRDLPETGKSGKDVSRVCKKTAEVKSEVEKKPAQEKEKKKVAPKTKDNDDKPKPKATPKTDKTRSKRKADTAEVPKLEDVEKKKMRRKKEVKEEKKVEPQNETTVKEAEVKPVSDVIISTKSAEKSEPAQSDQSWSPTYIPAPTLTQTVNIETKSEHDVIDEPAPQLSPIAGVSTMQPAPKEEPSKAEAVSEVQPEALEEPTREAPPTVFENTPPETPEGSPQASEPSLAEVVEVKSEPVCKEEPQLVDEIQDIPQADQMPGGDSPGACNTSTVSNGSGGSSGNAPGSESEDLPSSLKRPKSDDQDDDAEKSSSAKKRLKRPLKSTEKGSKKSRHKVSGKLTSWCEANMLDNAPSSLCSFKDASSSYVLNVYLFCFSASDSDESEHSKCLRPSIPSPSSPNRIGQRVSKYNFLDLGTVIICHIACCQTT